MFPNSGDYRIAGSHKSSLSVRNVESPFALVAVAMFPGICSIKHASR